AEALQEQGRWEESRQVVSAVEMFGGSETRRRLTLEVNAMAFQLRDKTSAETQLRDIKRHLEHDSDSSNSIELIRCGGKAAYFLNDSVAAEWLYQKAAKFANRAILLRDELILTKTLGLLAWIGGKSEKFAILVDHAVVLLGRASAEGLKTQSVAQLTEMKACLEVSLGRFSAAVESMNHAHAFHLQHLDEAMEALTAGNLSLAHYRLGNYGLARDWAITATLNGVTPETDWATLYSSLRLAKAQAMLSEASKAIGTAEDCSRNCLVESPWAPQSVGLLVADIYELCGEKRLALITASKALCDSEWKLRTRAFAGTFARWIAKVGAERGEWRGARDAFKPLLRDLSSHDLVDQAEILGAWGWFGRRSGLGGPDDHASLNLTLARLPMATGLQLHRLGFPPD
ncbi:MAG: hypothetical protein ABI587_12685, partial [Gemmatimonadales bacterium]